MKKVFLLLLTISLFSCAEKNSEPGSTLDGVWESVGYGRIVKIEKGFYIIADVTEISCLPLMDGNLSDFGEALTLKNDTLTLVDGINRYYFTRVDDAPPVCKKGSAERTAAEEKADDPEFNFEVLWQTFDDHYAYFELRKIDWDSMYKRYRPLVTEETTPLELYQIMDEMLSAFNDGHIGLDATEEIEIAAAKAEAKEQETDAEAPGPKRLRRHEVAAQVAQNYIPNGKSIKNNNLRWGILDDNVGYLQLNQMMGLANYGISDTLSYRDYWMAYFEKREESADTTTDELEGFNAALDSIMKDFDSTIAIVIDVRFNGGGKDEVGMALLERLNAERRPVFTKMGRLGDGFTPVVSVQLDASKNPYSNPVYLLISTESASATEIMALCALSLDNVTLLGSNTEGVFSDILDKELPNGWAFGLSSEVYLSMNGVNYEGPGIPPDVEINYPRDGQEFLRVVLSSIENGRDMAIEIALELIE